MEARVLQALWISLIYMQYVTTDDMNSRHAIIHGLLEDSDYDTYSVPLLDDGSPTNVTVQVLIRNLHSVSESSMDYSVDVLLRQWWRDYRLDFTALNSSVKKVELDPRQVDMVWQPDTYFPNEKEASLHKVTAKNLLMHIYGDGTVVTSMRLAMTFDCEMNLRMYPFDMQRCQFHIQSFAYTSDNIVLHWREEDPVMMRHTELPQYHLSTEVKTHAFIAEYPITGNFSALWADIYLSRKSGFHFLQVFIPSILLVSLSWVSFWVDPHAVPARVSLGVTCVLTMTTQSSGTRQTLPPVSYAKAIDVWMFVCLLFVFAALLEFAYVNVLLRREKTAEKENNADKQKNRCGRTPASMVDLIARVAFPGSFIIFLGVFALVCGLAGHPDETAPS